MSLPVVSFISYGFGTVGSLNTKCASTLMGTIILQTFVRTIQRNPFPIQLYKHGTLLQLSRNKVSRDSYLSEALQYYNPAQYKIKREMCLNENFNYKTNSFMVLVLHVVFSGFFTYACPCDLLVPKGSIFRKTKYQKTFQYTSESWQHFMFLIFLVCINT